MGTIAENLLSLRKAKKLSQTKLAEKSGVSQQLISQIENGDNVSTTKLPALAKVLGVPVSHIDPAYSEVETAPRDEVRLVGYVGAGAQAHFYATGDENWEMVPAPEAATETTVAVEVRGDSLGPLFEHWLVYYDDVRSPVTADQIGRLCVVGLLNDQVLVKKIRRSRTPGFFHLYSNTEDPILDVEIAWAARVRSMVPR